MLQFPAAHQQSCGRLQNLQSRRAAYITACAQLEYALCCLHAVRRPAVLPAAPPAYTPTPTPTTTTTNAWLRPKRIYVPHRGCEGAGLDVVGLALEEGDPGGGGEDNKGGDGEQRVGLDLLKHVLALGQLEEGGHSKAQHGQAAVDDLGGKAVKGLDLCGTGGRGAARGQKLNLMEGFATRGCAHRSPNGGDVAHADVRVQ